MTVTLSWVSVLWFVVDAAGVAMGVYLLSRCYVAFRDYGYRTNKRRKA